MMAHATQPDNVKDGRFPRALVTVAVSVTIVLLLWLGWVVFHDHEYFHQNSKHPLALDQELAVIPSQIMHLDEVLTMSARMAAATGQEVWIRRYERAEPELAGLIDRAKALAPTAEDSRSAAQTRQANDELVRMEHSALDLVRQGRRDQAAAVLDSDAYARNKRIYAEGMKGFVEGVTRHRRAQQAAWHRQYMIVMIIQGAGLAAVVATWWLALGKTSRAWARKLEENRQAAHLLRVSRERFRTTLESIGDGVIATDTGQRITQMNKVAQTMTGWTTEQAVGKPLTEVFKIIHGKTRQPAENPVDRVLATGQIQILANHTALVARNGTELSIADSAAPIRDEAGQVVGAVLVFRDVTAARHAQEQLRTSECRYRSLFEGTSDAVMLLLDETGFIECNQAALRMLRCSSPQDLIGRHPSEFSPPLQPDGRDSGQAACAWNAQAMETGQAQFEWLHWRKDHSEFPAEVFLTRVDLGDKMVLQAVVRDITERKKLERELAHMASHDPLTGLPNRRLLEDALHRAAARAARGVPSCLLVCDVDHFKLVNDALGHATGDQVLVQIVRLVQECLRTEDTMARLGGDEFAVLLEGSDVEQAAAIALRIRQAVSDFAFDAPDSVRPSLSIGLTAVDPGAQTQALLGRADVAMYAAKSQGRNRLVRDGAGARS